jgi:hypothetical protein
MESLICLGFYCAYARLKMERLMFQKALALVVALLGAALLGLILATANVPIWLFTIIVVAAAVNVLFGMGAKAMIVGYARVSTDGQTLDSQQAALRAAGAEKVFR